MTLERTSRIEKGDKSPCLFLFFSVLYFCHRLWGVCFPLEGDSLNNLYYQLNADLVAADYNPYHWGFMAGLPTGKNNPILVCLGLLWKLPNLNPISQAILINLSAALLSQYLLAISVYFFLKWLGFRRWVSALGSLVCTFTGFQLVGVREFTIMFPLGFACVPPLMKCFYQYCFEKPNKRQLYLGSLLIGFSLLCGTNVPLFYYLPFFLLFPILNFLEKKDFRLLLKQELMLCISVLGGLAVGAATWIPGMAYLSSMNRGALHFVGNQPTLDLIDKLNSLFLNDWWRVRGWRIPWWNSQETSFFLGAPIVGLALAGIWGPVNARKNLSKFMLGLLVTAMLISHVNYLGLGLEIPVSWFFQKLSMWNPTRFFMLMLIPLAYFSAKGFERIEQLVAKWVVALVGLISFSLAMVNLLSRWDRMIPAAHYSAVFSLGAAWVAVGLMLVSKAKNRYRIIDPAICLSVFLMYSWAPIQTTTRNWENLVHPEEFGAPPNVVGFLGLSFQYENIWKRAESLLLQSPSWVPPADGLRGRIFDELSSAVHWHYEAPQSRHEYAYAAIQDPASPKFMSELGAQLTEDLLDLNNACWAQQHINPSRPELGFKLSPRPSCLDAAFLVPSVKRIFSEPETLRWTLEAKRTDFLKRVAIYCGERGCPEIPEGEVQGIVHRGREHNYSVSASKSAMLFLSVPYRWDWQAEVNGVPTTVYRGNHAFLAVKVPQGRSTVRLTLSKTLGYFSLGLSSLAAVLLLILSFSAHFRLHFLPAVTIHRRFFTQCRNFTHAFHWH